MKVDITDRELEALIEVLNYSLDEEEEDCRQWCWDQLGTYELDQVPEEDKGKHIYWQLVILEKMVERINATK